MSELTGGRIMILRKMSRTQSHLSGRSTGSSPMRFTIATPASTTNSTLLALRTIFFSKICILLICVPLGIASPLLGWPDSCTFWLNFSAMIPLAKVLGDATEELAASLKNDSLSGLLNATFGNAVELIMTIALLNSHEYLVVKSTLLGSILSNMLLVLGLSFWIGGLCRPSDPAKTGAEKPLLSTVAEGGVRGKEQRFGKLGALVNTSLLLVSCLCLVLVTIFDHAASIKEGDTVVPPVKYTLSVSRACSGLIISTYVAYIFFQMVTHSDQMADEEEGEDDFPQEPGLSLGMSFGLLASTAAVVSVCSEFLTDSLEGALKGQGMGRQFVGIILLPIVGNACEHAAAIRFAMQDKIGLSVGIAVGSSVQIALFVTPFAVLMGWALGPSDAGFNMDLNFGALNVAVLTLGVFILLSIVVDGKTNWLEGYMLCVAYAIIAVLYWYMPSDVDTTAGPV